MLEIDGAIIGRYRSYEKAAEIMAACRNPSNNSPRTRRKLKELPGIGDRMVEHINRNSGNRGLRAAQKAAEKISRHDAGSAATAVARSQESGVAVEEIKAGQCRKSKRSLSTGKLRDVPGFGEKSEQNILKAIESFKRLIGRFLLQGAEVAAEAAGAHPKPARARSVTPAGSLRRGKETIGDLDLLVTLAEGYTAQKHVDALAEHILKFPGIDQTLAHGENKVSFTLENGLQVDVRLLKRKISARLFFISPAQGSTTCGCVAAPTKWAGR